MRRRDLIACAAGLAVAWPLTARAQEAGRTYRVGMVGFLPWDRPSLVAFREILRRQGFIEGKNLNLDRAGYGLRADQMALHAAELVEARADMILCIGDVPMRIGQAATKTIPVLGIGDDLVGNGFAASMAHPGGNITGVSIVTGQLDGKRQELLLQMLPATRHIAALVDASKSMAGSGGTEEASVKEMQATAARRGIGLTIMNVTQASEIGPAIEAARTAGAEGINVLASPMFSVNRRAIFERVATLRLPAIYQWPDMAQDGGLAGYGPDFGNIFNNEFVTSLLKLLRGAKPADLPVQQPSKFDLVINLKVADALGLTIPPLLLAQADEVIE